MMLIDTNSYYLALLTHKDLSLSELSDFYFQNIYDFLLKLKDNNFFGVLLQTCNRIEFYTYNQDPKEIFSKINFNHPFIKVCKIKRGFSVFEHLSRVVSGLESLAIGETQIVHQTRKAYQISKDMSIINPPLQFLFDEALKIGKRVRSKVNFSGSLDYLSATAKVLKEDLEIGSPIALLGTGDAAIEILSHLNKYFKIYLLGRNWEKVSNLANIFNAHPYPLDKLSEVLGLVKGLVIAIPEYSIKEEDLKDKIVVDLSLSGKINSSIPKKLYNMEYLTKLVEINKEKLGDKVKEAEKILEEELKKLHERLKGELMEKIIGRIYQEAERIRREEVEEALNKLKGKESFTKDELEDLLQNLSFSMVKKLYHHHSEELRKLAAKGYLDDETLSLIIKLFVS